MILINGTTGPRARAPFTALCRSSLVGVLKLKNLGTYEKTTLRIIELFGWNDGSDHGALVSKGELQL